MKCTELLIKEHHIILRALDVLDEMAALVEKKEPVEAADIETLLRFLRVFADDAHQAKEESALFPELLRTSAGNEPALRHMLFEHDQERSLVEGLEDSLHTKKGREFVELALRLSNLIRTHIRKEDYLLFDTVEHSLSPEQDERVTTALNEFRVEPSYLENLRRLEWRYLRR